MSKGGFPRSVVVYGTGLMGSSLALALRKYLPGIRVYGVDSADVLDRAQGLGAVEAGPAPDRVDLIILATPVGTILKWLDEVPSNAELILDVGSTKVAICRKAEARKLPFLGGHPMTGSERAGPEAASAESVQRRELLSLPCRDNTRGSDPEDEVGPRRHWCTAPRYGSTRMTRLLRS